MATTTDFPPPNELGFPDKFNTWRPNQVAALNAAIEDEHRHHAVIAPTGFGKSILYVAVALLTGKRTLFLTSSKGLQNQLMHDFSDMGMVDVRGRGNYRCRLDPSVMCDVGPCVAGVQCNVKADGKCDYFRAVGKAARSNMVVTNYSYWMHSQQYSGGVLGEFDLLVCDEGHGTPDVVCDYLTVELAKSNTVVDQLIPDWSVIGRFTKDQWQDWAVDAQGRVKVELDSLVGTVRSGEVSSHTRRRIARLKTLYGQLQSIRNMGGDWVVDTDQWKATFAPVWPMEYAENVLWRGVGKTLITSATLNVKTLEYLGLEEEDYSILEYPHTFPVWNRRLVHIPTIRMNHRAGEDDIRYWVSRMDQIIRTRQDRNGIIHTVSYQRRDRVMTGSKYGGLMMSHSNKDAESQVAVFKVADPPRILVSPSMATGWDFPDDECRYQIIGKLAYPDTRSKIIKERCRLDRDYGAYIAMQQLVQACGRGVRGLTDWCESFIVDDNVGWFMSQYGRRFAPNWFRECVVRKNTIPEPRQIVVRQEEIR